MKARTEAIMRSLSVHLRGDGPCDGCLFKCEEERQNELTCVDALMVSALEEIKDLAEELDGCEAWIMAQTVAADALREDHEIPD